MNSVRTSTQWKRDQKARDRHVVDAGKAFKKLLKVLKPYGDSATSDFKGRDKASRSRRGRVFVKYVKDLPAMTEYLDAWIGTTDQHAKAYSWRNAIIYQARDVLTQGKSIRDALVEVGKQAFKGYQAIEMAKAQAPLRAAIPEELRNFLPENIVVEVDETGNIERITDRFENEHLTLGKKIDKMHALVRDYNKIAIQVKKDLKSGDEVIKLSALITAIMMETGIRPGKEGNTAFKTVDGEKVEIETFGAITLGPNHVKFMRNNFASIEFVGKKGGKNISYVQDMVIIELLEGLSQKAKGSKYLFVTNDGRKVNYADVQRYFRLRFKDVAPTDFRKLRATEEVLHALRGQQASLYERIKGFAEGAKSDLKTRVIEAVVETLNRAIDTSQAALSHDNSATTVRAYINPEVVLRFLSTAQAEDTLEKAILTGKSTLSFDPDLFIERAMSRAASTGTSLMDILEELEEDLEDAGVSNAISRVAKVYLHRRF